MLRKGQEGHVRAERDILKSASLASTPNGADWIVRLYYSFQDRDHLYLVRDAAMLAAYFYGATDLSYSSYLIHHFIYLRSSSTWAAAIFSIYSLRRTSLKKISRGSTLQRQVFCALVASPMLLTLPPTAYGMIRYCRWY